MPWGEGLGKGGRDNVNMNGTVFCTRGLCSLSLWKRAAVRVPEAQEKPLTLTHSRWERGKKVPVKVSRIFYPKPSRYKHGRIRNTTPLH